MADERQPFADGFEEREPWAVVDDRLRPHEQQGPHDREIRDRVQEHEATDPERNDQHAAKERAHERRPVEGGGVESDRADQVAIRDETRHHRLSRRRVEGEDDRVERTDQDDLDDIDAAGDREGREHRRGDGGARLGEGEQAPAIRAIGDDAAEKPEREAGQRAREADEAEVERRELRNAVPDCELHDEPAEAELLHPCPDVRDDEPDPEEAEVAIKKCREGRGAAGLGGGGFVERFVVEIGGERVLICGHARSSVPQAARVHGSRTHHGTQAPRQRF